MAARDQRLRLVIERAQQLTLPAVPDAGADGQMSAHVRTRSSFSRSGLCTIFGERADRFGIGNIARMSEIAHRQMLFDEPGHKLGLGGRHSEARTELAGYARSDDRMIFLTALADVVQECCDEQRPSVLDRAEDRGRERQLGGQFAALDRSYIAERPQQMLIDRVVMIHVELHHRDDTTELGHEPAEYAGFVHAPAEILPDYPARSAATEKCWLASGLCLQIIVDQPQRRAKQPDRVGMQVGVRRRGLRKEANEIDRIAL